MAGSAVSTRESVAVPALAPTPATTISAEDIAVPRLYIGQFMSDAVQQQRVKMGDIYSALASDDSEPEVLWHAGSKDPGVLFHVLHLRKAKSWSPEPGAPLELFDYDDPAAPERAWVTYNYTFCLPEVDPDMPFKMLLTRTGRPAAQKINTVLMRNASAGPSFAQAFRLTTAERKNDKGRFAVAQISVEQADPTNVNAASELYDLLAPGFARSGSYTATSGEEPEI